MIELLDCAEEHRWLLHRWRNSELVAPYMYDDQPISRDTHDRWFSSLLASKDRRGWVVQMDGDPVGAAFISEHDASNRRASWAFYLAEDSTRGRGVGSAVEFQVLEYAFCELGLHKLCCEVLSFNGPVIAMHKKFGFVEEGILREQWNRRGEWVDTHVLALFESDWLLRRDEMGATLRGRGLIH